MIDRKAVSRDRPVMTNKRRYASPRINQEVGQQQRPGLIRASHIKGHCFRAIVVGTSGPTASQRVLGPVCSDQARGTPRIPARNRRKGVPSR